MNIPLREIITVKEASDIAGVTDEAIYGWAVRHKIGRQPHGQWAWQISLPALLMVMDRKRRDFDALDALQAGDRQNPAVAEYIDRAETIRAARLIA